MSSGRRCLIVTADDFGRSAAINHGVALAHERGIVTSASLMVRWPAAADAAAYARRHPALGTGLHFDLGEWVHDGSGWAPVYRVVEDDRGAAVAGDEDGVPIGFEVVAQEAGDVLVVVRHQHRLCLLHAAFSLVSVPVPDHETGC